MQFLCPEKHIYSLYCMKKEEKPDTLAIIQLLCQTDKHTHGDSLTDLAKRAELVKIVVKNHQDGYPY